MYKIFLGCFLLGLVSYCKAPKKAGDKVPPVKAAAQEENAERLVPTNPRMLRRSLFNSGRLLLVYGTGQAAFTEKYRQISTELAESYGSRMQVQVLPDSALSEDSLSTYPAIILGTLKGHKWLPTLWTKLPFGLQNDSLLFAQKTYPLQNAIWNFRTYPNPYNPFLPISIITSHSDELLLTYLEGTFKESNNRFGRSPWDYELIQEDKRLMMGYFSHRPEDPWAFDPAAQWDYFYHPNERRLGEYFPYILHGNVAPEELSRVWDAAHDALNALHKEVGIPLKKWDFPLHVFESAEAKGMELGNTQQAHVEFDQNRICLVAHEAFPYVNVAPINRMLIRKGLGKAQQSLLEEGLANLYSAPWSKGGAKEWGKRLYQAGESMHLEELLSAPSREDSPLIRACMTALWVEFLRETVGGGAEFKQTFLSWNPTAGEIKALDIQWMQFLAQLPSVSLTRKVKNLPSGPIHLKGFNFAHEGYNIYDGYISQKAKLSIQRLNGLGSSSLAIVPYTGTGNTQSPTRFRFSNFAGGENDESVIMSAHYSRQLGMTSMLKPQIWVRGAWPGDIQMKTQEDWDVFFQNYRHWILHYAILAELHEMDILCIGVELKYATLEQPEAWRALIQQIRNLYAGPLVYAANWGEEFEGLSFWEELDYIGIDFYYPLGEKEDISEKELRQNFRKELNRVKQVAEKYNKPVLLTEIGFRSITAPWQMPHEHPRNKAHNAQHQAICYRIVLEELQKQEWCKGIYFWKWPSYIEFTRPNDKDYSPIGKPAEAVLQELF